MPFKEGYFLRLAGAENLISLDMVRRPIFRQQTFVPRQLPHRIWGPTSTGLSDGGRAGGG